MACTYCMQDKIVNALSMCFPSARQMTIQTVCVSHKKKLNQIVQMTCTLFVKGIVVSIEGQMLPAWRIKCYNLKFESLNVNCWHNNIGSIYAKHEF